MHVYIYDDYLNRGKYHQAINRMEIRLTDLGLNGKIIRLGGIKNIKGTIQSEMKLGAKTIIAVGNNQTVNKIIGAIVDNDAYGDFQEKTLLGIIPVGDDNSIATSFGIKNEEEAAQILLARRIKKIDLGLAGQHYFLQQATIPTLGTTLDFGDYSLEAKERGEVRIINLLSDRPDIEQANPYDGFLDIYIRTRRRDETKLITDRLKITSGPENKLLLDNVLAIATPIEVGIMKEKINVIVGRDRRFE